MEINTFVMLSLLVFLIILVSLYFYLGSRQEKQAKKERITRIQKHVKEDLEAITRYATRYGDTFYDTLMDFADKMEKLSDGDVKADLKPYDVYNVKRLSEYLTMGKLLGRIVVNKNLEPRFMTSLPSTDAEVADIELEAALTIGEVKELADKCRKIKMDVDIESFRKEKVKKAINNK